MGETTFPLIYHLRAIVYFQKHVINHHDNPFTSNHISGLYIFIRAGLSGIRYLALDVSCSIDIEQHLDNVSVTRQMSLPTINWQCLIFIGHSSTTPPNIVLYIRLSVNYDYNGFVKDNLVLKTVVRITNGIYLFDGDASTTKGFESSHLISFS